MIPVFGTPMYLFHYRDTQMEIFNKFSTYFDAAVKTMQKMSADQTQKCQTHYKREFQSIGKVFIQMGQAIQQDGDLSKFIMKLLWGSE